MSKTKTKPEVSIDKEHPDFAGLVDRAKQASDIRIRLAGLQTEEKKAKKYIEIDAKTVRESELKKGNYVGLIRVIDDSLPPVRIEFRNNGKCLDVGQEQELDRLFGASRPLIFKREKVVTDILDPEKVIADLKAAGKNPWDFIKIDIKDNQDSVVAENTDGVKSDEGFVGQKDMLSTLNNIGDTLTQEAQDFIKEYLEHTLDTKVVLGTKG
jgi:hypothetical protein